MQRRSVDLVIARDPLIGNLADPTPICGYIAQTHANLGWLGTASVKCFGILVGVQGGGYPKMVQTGQIPDRIDRADI